MYKVFVNESPLILTNKLSDTTNNKYFLLNGPAINEAIDSLADKRLKEAFIYHPNHEEIIKKFSKKVPLVVAAGGVVTNKGGRYFLYIGTANGTSPRGSWTRARPWRSAPYGK